MIAGFTKGRRSYFNSPSLAQFCTQRNQSATKSVLRVQVAYCPKFILDSTGNALEKDKLIQQTQQKKSAAFSHPQTSLRAAPPGSNGCTQMSKTFPKKEYKPLYLQLAQAHLALDRTQTLFSSQTTGSLHTSQILMVLVLAGIFQNENCK